MQIVWFRQDLRLSDNPALSLAADQGDVLPVYILDEEDAGDYVMGSASKWWLHHSLNALNASLQGNLSVYRGKTIDILLDIAARYNVSGIYWNRGYEPWRTRRDAEIKKQLHTINIKAESTNGSLLWEPWTVQKDDGTPYKVFTPFYRKGCLKKPPPQKPLPAPEKLDLLHDTDQAIEIDQLNLLPELGWDKQLESHWEIGEKGAQKQFHKFVEAGLQSYKEGRNYPAKANVSRLSPHLHFGEISPHQLWHAVSVVEESADIDHFRSELGWREFSYSLLFHNPDLPKKNLQSKFDDFPWVKDTSLLKAWQKGQTGVPMVDAGMRELWQTGYMHNRVRMIVASFLVKNLRLHWHHGETWFWDTLVDADLANNSASWQWVAGCGADAAPYFRIFNPVTQGKKFDPEGTYIRKFVPEITSLPDKYIFSPWEAPEVILKEAGIILGETYPRPIVDSKRSRIAALEAFASLKQIAP
ncbi:MAG: deoxyribodipyrimidine photo-lyase [Sneathiella sp.]